MQSKFDPCLFYRVNESEVTYICLFVDDTYVFSNKPEHMDAFVSRMQKYYQVTLDIKGDSFLGIQFTRQIDGSTTLTYPAEAIEQTPQGIPIPRPEVHSGPPLRPYAQSRPTNYRPFTSGESIRLPSHIGYASLPDQEQT